MGITQTIGLLKSNPEFLNEFGHMKGHGSQETKWGLNRLTEQLRRVEYMKLAAHAPRIYGGLYEKANSVKEMNENDARNAAIIKRTFFAITHHQSLWLPMD